MEKVFLAEMFDGLNENTQKNEQANEGWKIAQKEKGLDKRTWV